jgi:hypothetical protein
LKNKYFTDPEEVFNASISNTKILEKRSISPNWQNNAQYKIEIATAVFLMGKQISENKTESIWHINFNNHQDAVNIEVIDKKNIKVNGQIALLVKLLDKINKTTDNLQLKLNEDGTIQNVLDIDAILKKWETIKFEELRAYELEHAQFKQIIEAYDTEFNNLGISINQNILYQLFFYPLGNVQFPNATSEKINNNIITTSQLFAQQKINYDLFYSSKINENKIEVNCYATLNKNWDTKAIGNVYKNDYAALLGTELDFNFLLEAKYIHALDGVMEKATVYIKEQANEGLFYISQYNFTLLKEVFITDK